MRCLLIFLPILFHSLFAQPTSLNGKTHKALNRYIEYINQDLHALWMMQHSFTQFNRELNRYYFEFPTDAEERAALEKRKGKLQFVHRDICSQAFPPSLQPDALLKQIQKDSLLIRPHSRSILMKRLLYVEALMNELDAISQKIELYTQSKTYLTDPALQTAYDLLGHAAAVFEEFEREKNILYEDIRAIYFTYEPESPNSYGQASGDLLRALQHARGLLKAMRKEVNQKIESHNIQLKVALDAARKNQAESLSSIARLEANNPNDLHTRYAAFLDAAQAFQQQSQAFLSDEADHLPYGIYYHYHNQQLLPHFNRYGQGLAYQYNRFVDVIPLKLLKEMEEMILFVPLYPVEGKEVRK